MHVHYGFGKQECPKLWISTSNVSSDSIDDPMFVIQNKTTRTTGYVLENIIGAKNI